MSDIMWCPPCSACAPDCGIGVFSMAQGTVWRCALFSSRACWSDLGTSFHMAAGKRFHKSAYCLPHKPVQVMPLTSINNSKAEPQKPVTACRSRQNSRPRADSRGQSTPAPLRPRGHHRYRPDTTSTMPQPAASSTSRSPTVPTISSPCRARAMACRFCLPSCSPRTLPLYGSTNTFSSRPPSCTTNCALRSAFSGGKYWAMWPFG
ncbi:hypothetical protein D3C76_1033260 [compost metagenome]